VLHQLAQQRVQGRPHLLVPEEGGELDEHGGDEGVDLVGVPLQQRQVRFAALAPGGGHAPLDAALQRGALVVAEVEVAHLAHLLQDGFELGVAGVPVGHVRGRL
jgi:hypothetical protein